MRLPQATLTRIFIVSTHKFRPNSEIQTLFQPKNRWSPKKKGFRQIWNGVFGQNEKFKRFFGPKTGDLEKKGHRRIWNGFFGQNRKFRRFFRSNHGIFGTQIPLGGGLFSIFQQKSASKAPKTCDFEYFTSQWGGGRAPPWLHYCKY